MRLVLVWGPKQELAHDCLALLMPQVGLEVLRAGRITEESGGLEVVARPLDGFPLLPSGEKLLSGARTGARPEILLSGLRSCAGRVVGGERRE